MTNKTSLNLPSNDRGKVNQPVQPCDMKPESTRLVITDEEDSVRHYDNKCCLLEIVEKKEADGDIVNFFYFGGNNKPFSIKVDDQSESAVTFKEKARKYGKSYSVPISYAGKDNKYIAGKSGFFGLIDLLTYYDPPTIYRALGIDREIIIKAYNPNQWALKIELPPLRSKKVGVKYQNSDIQTTHATKKSSKEIRLTETSNFRNVTTEELQKETNIYTFGLSNGLKTKYDEKSSKKQDSVGYLSSFQLEKNGIRQNAFAINILPIIQFVKTLTSLIESFNEMTPQAGWYSEFSLKLLEGSLNFSWGWRETSEHLAYYHFGAAVKATIIQVHFEFGFGIKSKGVLFQICLRVSGGVNTEFGVQTLGPIVNSIPIAELSPEFDIGAHVRFKAGDLVQIEGMITTGIKIQIKFELTKNCDFEVKGEVTWTGLAVNVKVTTAFGGSYTKKYPLVPEISIKKFDIIGPNSSADSNSSFSYSSLQKSVKDMIENGYNIRVFEYKVKPYKNIWGEVEHKSVQEQLDADSISDEISDAIWAHEKNLTFTTKIIDGILQKIRKDLDSISEKSYQRDYLEKPELLNYLKSDRFKITITEAYCVGKMLMKDLN